MRHAFKTLRKLHTLRRAVVDALEPRHLLAGNPVDSFGGVAGASLNGLATGADWNAAWVADSSYQVRTASLVYTDRSGHSLISGGGSIRQAAGSMNLMAARAAYLGTATELWYAVSFQTAGAQFDIMPFSQSDATGPAIRCAGDQLIFQDAAGGARSGSTINAVRPGVPNLLVVRLHDVVANGSAFNYSMTLYVNPADLADVIGSSTTATWQVTGGMLARNGTAVRNATTSASAWVFDDVRLGSSLATVVVYDTPLLKANGIHIRTNAGTGEILQLRGTNIGSWLFWENWQSPLDSTGMDDATARTTLINRFGTAQAEALIDTYQDNWFTEADLDNIRDMGFNHIRLPFTWQEVMNSNGTMRADAFARLDWAITEAWNRGIYTIPVFHYFYPDKTAYFTNTSAQGYVRNMWAVIADHYKGNPAIASFDLLNEPTETPSSTTLWNCYDGIYDSVRAVDPNRMLSLEATYGSWNWSMLPDPATYGWSNVNYQFHMYTWSGTSDSDLYNDINGMIADFKSHQGWNVPCYIGEFNEFQYSQSWSYAVARFAENGINWTEWNYKATHGTGTDSWGLCNPITMPTKPNLSTDSYATIQSLWSASKISTAGAFAANPTLHSRILPRDAMRLAQVDIGSPAIRGVVTRSADTYSITAGGNDIWGSSDQFTFATQSTRGDQIIIARVASVQNTDPVSKAGVMFRSSTAAGAMFVNVTITPGAGALFEWRSTTGGSCGNATVSGVAAPSWVKLARSGNSFSAYYSTDGSQWFQIGSVQTIGMPSTYLAGLAVSSHNGGASCTASFDSVTLGRLHLTEPRGTYQMERGTFGGGTILESSSFGFNGTGYLNFPSSGGYGQISNVDGYGGGNLALEVRYASSTTRTGTMYVNGVAQGVTFPATGAWTTYATVRFPVLLNAGLANTIRFESTGQDLANVDQIQVINTAPSAPAAPTNLTAAKSKSKARLAWTDNAGNETGFHVWSSRDGANWTLMAALGANATSYTTASLSAGTWYFRVTSYNTNGDSPGSNIASLVI